MLEEELKFDVDEDFVLPDVDGLTAKGHKKLTATYYDTADLRLARSGATLRHRVGDELPWTVKLPSGVPGVRHEISSAGLKTRPPADFVWLVASLTRGAPLRRVAVLRSDRRVFLAGGVEVADDRVLSGRMAFREIELELVGEGAAARRSLSTLEKAMRRAGAEPSPWPSKLARVLGDRALRPPDLVAPAEGKQRGTGQEVVRQAIRRGAQRILWHDPLVRLGDPLPDGDTPVHQMRVGCRRLRSDLRTFSEMLDPEWTGSLREELKWIAGLLGAARDAEVLRARLQATAAADSLAPVDPAAVAAIDGRLAERHALALKALDDGMRTERYVALVEALTAATREQPFAGEAFGVPPDKKLEAKASALTADGPDEAWHRVRILAKRARYAADALGHKGRAKRLAAVQELLGEHQDAAVAAQTWLEFGGDPAVAVTAGRLFERERARIREIRAAFPSVWAKLEPS
ncbi:MAG TPA: CYTH and CHAD domain-containing protein [Candidatus Limnocylindrales bacterium]